MQLVKLVLKRRMPLLEAIEILGIKVTTARFIISKYKETGTFPHRKFKRRGVFRPKPKVCKEEGL